MNDLWYKGPNPTVDMVLVTGDCLENARILVVERATEPFLGGFALPGGFIDSDSVQGGVFIPRESPADAALREVMEETSVEYSGKLYPLGIFEGGGRDPRDGTDSWTRSHAFMAYVKEAPATTPQAGEVVSCHWVKLTDILHGDVKTAFDHDKIIKAAVAMMRIDDPGQPWPSLLNADWQTA